MTVDMEEEVNVKRPDVKVEPGLEGAADDGDSDSDDPVVRSYDVIVGNRLFEHLHLFQFPLRPTDRNYNFEKMKAMRMQMKSQRFQLEFGPTKAKGAAHSLVEEEEEDSEAADNDRPYLLSSRRVRNKTNYAVGILRNGEMHITGLQNMHQFRPDMGLTMQLNQAKEEASDLLKIQRAAEETEKKDKKDLAREEMMEARYAGRLRSKYLQELELDSWINLTLSTAGNPECKRGILQRLFGSTAAVPMNPKHTTQPYLRNLFKRVYERWQREANAKIPISQMAEFDWRKQVDSIVLNAKVTTYSVVRGILQPKDKLPSDADLLKYLGECCVVIRGMFVVKMTPDLSPTHAVAREWILWNVWRHPRLRREELTAHAAYKLDVDVHSIRKMLEDVADLVDHEDWAQRVWVLRNGVEDPQFVSENAAFCERQDALWGGDRADAVLRNVKADGRPPILAFPWKPSMAGPSQPSGAAQQEQLVVKWVQQFAFKNVAVWNPLILLQRFKEAKTKHAALANVSEDLYQRMVKQITRPLGDGIILRTRDQDRETFVSVLLQRATWKRADLEAESGVAKPVVARLIQQLCQVDGMMVSPKPGYTAR